MTVHGLPRTWLFIWFLPAMYNAKSMRIVFLIPLFRCMMQKSITCLVNLFNDVMNNYVNKIKSLRY